MPFKHEKRPYTREDILALSPNQNGVYGIFRDTTAVYIGSGNIRECLLAHINGDNPCITQNTPNQWIGEVLLGDPTRKEGELIREYRPTCNKVVPQ